MIKIDNTTPSAKFCKLIKSYNRRKQSVLVQLRTGHVPLQQYLHRIKKVDSPVCPSCGRADETVFHYVMICSAYEIAREELRSQLDRSLFTLPKLLSEKEAVELLFKFVDATGRFKGKFSEIAH